MQVKRVSTLLVSFLVAALAQNQVATVSSDTAFQLRGANIAPGQGVPNWPVMPGDAIKAGETPVTVSFPDGSTIVLAPRSSAKIGLAGQKPVFQLLGGSAHYSLKDLNSIVLMAGKDTVAAKDLVGDLALGGNKPSAGWWTTSHTVAVVGGAAAATGLAIGVVQSRKEPSQMTCGGQSQNQQGCP